MNYREFVYAIHNLRMFMIEQDNLDAVLKVIAPSSTAVCEFGNKFIDDYIKVVGLALGVDDHWVSWFVFDNEFGCKHLTISIEGKNFTIHNNYSFYRAVQKLKNQ